MQKYARTAIVLTALVLTTTLQSCNVLCKSKTKDTATTTMEKHPKKVNFKTPLESIDILFSESSVVTVIPNDFDHITDLLEKAKYDKKWNDTGMMVKMRAPDYSLNVKTTGETPRMVFLWEEGNRVKVDATWYLLEDADTKKLSAFLSKYKM